MKRDGISVLIPPAIASVLLLGLGIAGAWYGYSMEKRVTQAIVTDLSVTLATEHFVQRLDNLRRSLRTLANDKTETCLDSSKSLLNGIEDAFDEMHSKLNNSSMSFESNCVQVQSGLKFLKSRLDAISPGELRNSDAIVTNAPIDILKTQVYEPALQLLANVETETTRVANRNKVITQRVGLAMLLLGMTGAVAGLVLGYGIARYVSQSVVQMSLKIQDITGKYDEAVGTIEISEVESLEGVNESLGELAKKTADIVLQLSRRELQAERAEQLSALGKLAAGLAHEIRNPLASMKLLVQSAQEKPQGKSLSSRDLEVLEQEIFRLEKMLKIFIDFARPPVPEKSLVDLRLAIDRTVSIARLRAKQQHVLLHWNRPKESFDGVVDASQLQQSLLNLLLNSLDVLPAGGNINISLKKHDVDNSAIISVFDDGPGIPADALPRIFEPFFSTKDQGLGLGLPICKKMVEQHDGTIEFGTGDEGGAKFTIYLPLSESA